MLLTVSYVSSSTLIAWTDWSSETVSGVILQWHISWVKNCTKLLQFESSIKDRPYLSHLSEVTRPFKSSRINFYRIITHYCSSHFLSMRLLSYFAPKYLSLCVCDSTEVREAGRKKNTSRSHRLMLLSQMGANFYLQLCRWWWLWSLECVCCVYGRAWNYRVVWAYICLCVCVLKIYCVFHGLHVYVG